MDIDWGSLGAVHYGNELTEVTAMPSEETKDVDNSSQGKSKLKLYLTLCFVFILTVVVLSEVVISQRSGSSINMDVFGRVLEVITSVLLGG